MTLRGKHLLVVDDDDALREHMSLILREQGYAVVCAANGLDALEHVARFGAPALVLIDLIMPVMDGRQFLAEWRKWSLLEQVPVVLMTAHPNVDARQLGAADIISKPIDLDVLYAMIHAHAGHAASSNRAAPRDNAARSAS